MATDITDSTLALETASLLKVLGKRPRILALGEPTHGEDTLLHVRNELFQQLVEQEGYRTIALESDCLMGLVVDEYVTSGSGSLDEVMERGFSHGLGASAANRELVRWVRSYNGDRPASEQVRFAGFDGPLEITGPASPRQALAALHDYLASHVEAGLLPRAARDLDDLLRADQLWMHPDAMMEPARSVGQSAEAAQLRLLADDLVALLEEQVPHLVRATSWEDLERARLYGRTAVGLLRYHHWMADTSPSRMNRLLSVRDRMMAENLLALAEHGPVLAFAQNAHFQREKSSMGMWQGPVEWWSAGALVNARLGDDYAFAATALGTIRHRGVDAPAPETLEGLLYALPGDRCVVDPRRLATAFGDTPPEHRASPWFGYAPFDPNHLAAVDGIVFVKDTVPNQAAQGQGAQA
ncbi:erythromycin esterase family protein [Nocardiopsis ganjiahuensis]|uniref:erythromycin esterase family protein n=1 Tax=Nocardiopsis ganjiahuensis TaxID=239984 RepID=UPI00034A4964|nr:erythromycin esterase family protein [Nocardiopsis ganjiahuensis]